MIKKKIYKLSILISLAIIVFSNIAISQNQDGLPSSFMMGDYEQKTEVLGVSCQAILLDVYQDSMDLAYTEWVQLLIDMEKLSDSLSFDLRGIKLWMNVYWNEDGSIRHIVFHPKPNSRNMDFTELTAFFSTFVNRYSGGMPYSACYTHYASVSFPTFGELYLRANKN